MTTINKQISLGTDDCFEQDDTGFNPNFATNKIGYASGSIYDVGLRWQSLNIPQGATIISAKLSLYLVTDVGTLVANIIGIDEDNTVTWAADDRPSQRTKTTATITANKVNWDNWTVDSWIDIDITNVVKEIIDRGGWSANNDLAVVIEGSGSDGNYIAAGAYEQTGNLHGAKLDIVHTSGQPMPVLLHLYNQMRQ